MSYSLATNIATLKPSSTEQVDNTIKRMEREGIHDIISLGVGEPCFDTPTNIIKAAQFALKSGNTHYQPTAGDYELREAISIIFKRDNGIHASMDDIIVTPGAKFAIYLALQAMLQPGDSVLILDPAWVSHDAIPHIMGANVIHVSSSEVDGFHPDLAAIRRAMLPSVKLIIINSPCNPTGAVFNKESIRKIVELAKDFGALVLSDEIYGSLIFEGKHFSPASEYNNVITVNGFSKTYAMTGWRLGYVTGPEEILEGMIKIYQHSASCVTSFAQAGAIEALQSPESEKAVRWMVSEYAHRRALMMGLIERSGFFSCPKAQGAFYCFPSYRSQIPSVDLSRQLLKETHVATLPGVAFGACGEYHLRLSYATTEEKLLEAFSRIGDYTKKISKDPACRTSKPKNES